MHPLELPMNYIEVVQLISQTSVTYILSMAQHWETGGQRL